MVQSMPALNGVDPEAVIFPETDETEAWTVKDLIGHITAWEEEGVRGLQAYIARKQYFVSEEIDDYNARQVARRKGFSYARILEDWQEVREILKETIASIPPEKMKVDWTFAWGDEGGTVPRMIESLIAHEDEHMGQIMERSGNR